MARLGIAQYIGERASLKISIQLDEHYGVGSILHALAAFRVRCWQFVKAIADG